MGYLLKDTSALLDIKLTDAARKKISEGNFNIRYFQVGDSEVCYNCGSNPITDFQVLKSNFPDQSNSPSPERNRSIIKYPIYINSTSNNTFGIPINSPYIDEVYNTASPRGFFTGTTNNQNFLIQDSSRCINSSYETTVTNFVGDDSVTLILSTTPSVNLMPSIYNYIAFYFSTLNQPIVGHYPVLIYKIKEIFIGDSVITVVCDRNLPNLVDLGYEGSVKAVFYPSTMVPYYDYETPDGYFADDGFNFESNCDSNGQDVKIWNMNIPWRESVAGTFTSTNKGYEDYGSYSYLSTMEYLGYLSDDGQEERIEYYYNSFGEKVFIKPENQKCVAIVHYSNNTIDNFYGEKFALKPFGNGDTGDDKNFSLSIPWLMWHKNKDQYQNMGENFYVAPPGFEDLELNQIHYINSKKSAYMNDPGLRYYYLWDTHGNEDGYPNRVGKVWPDLKMVTFDDEEIVAAMNYKANRNWTLPAPKISLVPPNTYNNVGVQGEGLLLDSNETLWVTYRFTNNQFTNSLHCNYYQQIQGQDITCSTDSSNVLVRFGDEFNYLNYGSQNNTFPSGYLANKIEIIVQKTQTGQKPVSNAWKVIDVTSQLDNPTGLYFITKDMLTNATIQISKVMYDNALTYNLNNYITIPTQGSGSEELNFGDEFFFYGTIKTDIAATIYVMNYSCILGNSQFNRSSNPTSSTGTSPYITEIGLYDSNKDLMVSAKVQSPEKRTGVQNYSIKIDF